MLTLLLGVALAQDGGWNPSSLPEHLAYRPLSRQLEQDGRVAVGSRTLLRAEVQDVVVHCPRAADIEANRRVRWRVGGVLAFVGTGTVVVSSLLPTSDPDRRGPLVPMAVGAGVGLVGGGLVLSANSLQPSIRAYNACEEPKTPPPMLPFPTG